MAASSGDAVDTWRCKKENFKRYTRNKFQKNKRMEINPYPLEIFVEVSNSCNIQCKMCASFSPLRLADNIEAGEPGFISAPLLEKLFPIFKGALMLHAYGFGEPLLSPHFLPLLKEAKNSQLYVDFFTNGSLLEPAISEQLVYLRVERITVSINGADAKTYKEIHTHGEFETVIQNLLRLKEIKKKERSNYPRVSLNILAMNCNFLQLPDFISLADSIGIEHISLKSLVIYENIPAIHHWARKYQPGEDNKRIDLAREMASQRGISLDFNAYLATDNHKSEASPKKNRQTRNTWCFQPFKTFYVKRDGTVKTCCFSHKPILGNLNYQDFKAIWEGEPYQQLRQEIKKGNYPESCVHCQQFNLQPIADDASYILSQIEARNLNKRLCLNG